MLMMPPVFQIIVIKKCVENLKHVDCQGGYHNASYRVTFRKGSKMNWPSSVVEVYYNNVLHGVITLQHCIVSLLCV